MKKILAEITEDNDTKSTIRTEIHGTNIEVLRMISSLMGNLSECSSMSFYDIAFYCILLRTEINDIHSIKEREKPATDGDFDISLEDLQKLLNDIDGKEN